MFLRDLTLNQLIQLTKKQKDIQIIVPLINGFVHNNKNIDKYDIELNRLFPTEIILETLPMNSCTQDDMKHIIETIAKQIPSIGHHNNICVKTFIIDDLVNNSEKEVQTDHNVAVFSIDPIEQHSKHLPLGTDIFISKAIKNKLITKNCDFVSVVDMNYSLLRWALGIGGSISISDQTFFKILNSYVDLILSKYDKLIIVSTHMAKNSTEIINTAVSRHKSRILYIQPLVSSNIFNLDQHAGMLETSLMTYLYYDKVILTNSAICDQNQILTATEINELFEKGLDGFTKQVKSLGWSGIVSDMAIDIIHDFKKNNKSHLALQGNNYWDMITQDITSQVKPTF